MLMHLSEASNRELRMADLAEATGLSASRTTRLVGDLISSSGRQSPDAAQPPRHNTSANGGEPRGTLSAADMQPAWRAPSASSRR